MTNGTRRQCRERLLAHLVDNDPDPKIYPISPPPDGFQVVCVWEHEGQPVVATLQEFQDVASSYQCPVRCLYFTVPSAVADDALTG